MRLAAAADRIHEAGGEVIAISVDDETRQAGMFERWPAPHVLFVSDPGGETHLRRLGLYDPDERGGIALPAMLVISPDGSEAYRYQGRDFADRTTDDEVFAALEGLGLDAVDPPPGGPVGEVPDDLKGFFPPSSLTAYFQGTKFAAIAIGRRVDDDQARAIAGEHRSMADATIDAWRAIRPRASS